MMGDSVLATAMLDRILHPQDLRILTYIRKEKQGYKNHFTIEWENVVTTHVKICLPREGI